MALEFSVTEKRGMIKDDCIAVMLSKLSGPSPGCICMHCHVGSLPCINQFLLGKLRWNEAAVKGEGNDAMCPVGYWNFLGKRCVVCFLWDLFYRYIWGRTSATHLFHLE